MMKRISYLLTLVLLFQLGTAMGQYSDHRNRKVDSLERVVSSDCPPKGEELLQAYLNLMWGYLQTDGKKSEDYAQKAIDLARELKKPNAQADALRIIGLIHYGMDDYETALDYYDKALEVTELMKKDKSYNTSDIDDNLSAIYGSIANVYNMQDKAHLAIHYYQLALTIFEKYGWEESTAIAYYNIGELYNSMGNSAERDKNYLKAVEHATASGDSLLIAMSHKGLAKIYASRDEYERTEQSAQICMDYYGKHIDEERDNYIVTLLIMARIQLNHYGDLDKAEALINQAGDLITEFTDSETLGDYHNACCELAMRQKRWSDAEQHAWAAINAGEAVTYNDLGSYVYLTQIYAELGETQRVKECVVTIFNGMEQFATDNYQASLSELEVLYETEKKQAAIEQLKKEKRWLTTGAILSGCILLLLAILFFLLWRIVRQSKKNAVVKAKLDGELSERVRIARDLHDRLGGLLTAIKQNVEPDSTAANLTDQATREMRNVAHHLLPSSLQRYGLKTALDDFCKTMKKVCFAYYGEDKHIEHEEVVYCIVHELINNAVKSAEADHIQVQLFVNEDCTTINVCDDGNGKLDFDTDGAGLTNIRERLEAIGGTMSIYAKPGEGSEINIELKTEQHD